MLFVSLTDISHYIIEHRLEVFAMILSIAGVWLTALEKISNWPINIAASAIYIYIFYNSGIYLDTGISIFYVAFSFYGWYEWLYGGKNKTEIEISRITGKTIGTLLLISVPVTAALIWIMVHYTDSTIPYLDSITTVMSLAGTWMMAKKHIENWIVWIIADSIYVAEYIIKGLYPTAVLYFIFTLLAIYGYYEWKKQLRILYA